MVGSDRMQCMEVWGGNHAVDQHLETAGLEIWVYSRPYRQAAGGGDVHYLSSCASGRITRMLLADVSGHGEVVSQTAIGLRELMRRNVNYVNQTRFVHSMNRQFIESFEDEGFATAVVSTFFAPTRSYTICNAGHPAPLMYDAAASTWSELTGDQSASDSVADLPLGITGRVSYRQFAVRLKPGDMVLSYTDAVSESIDADGRQLGQTGVLQLVRELNSQDHNLRIPTIIERITSLSEGNLQQDDATLLLCRATGSGSTLKNNLLAPFRLLRPVTDRTTIG